MQHGRCPRGLGQELIASLLQKKRLKKVACQFCNYLSTTADSGG